MSSSPYRHGTVKMDANICIYVNHQRWQFPLSDDSITTLIPFCQQAKFGHGNQHVLDISYRNAYVVNDFVTSFSPYSYPDIMKGINDLLCRETSLKLERLNIYPVNGFLNVIETHLKKFISYSDSLSTYKLRRWRFNNRK